MKLLPLSSNRLFCAACIFAVVVLCGIAMVRTWKANQIETHWQDVERQWMLDAETAALTRYQAERKELLDIAGTVGRSPVYSQSGTVRTTDIENPDFKALDDLNPSKKYTIEVVDSTGSVSAWSGKSIRDNYFDADSALRGDSAVFLTEIRHHIYLSVVLRIPASAYSVVASKAIESRDPLNPGREKVGLTGALAEQIKTSVDILIGNSQRDAPGNDALYIPLKDFHGRTIGFIACQRSTRENMLESETRPFGRGIAAAAAVVIILLGIIFIKINFRFREPLLTVAYQLIVLWGARYGLILLDLPQKIFGTGLFDPALYASSFGYGLTATLGDLFISVAALVCSALLLFRLWVKRRPSSKKKSSLMLVADFFFICFLSFVLMWLLRGYGSAVDSFVADSTIHFHDPSVFIPNAATVIFFLTILGLSVAMLALSYIVVEVIWNFWRKVNLRKNIQAWMIVVVQFVLVMGIFFSIDEIPQTPFYSVAVILFFFFLAHHIIKRQHDSISTAVYLIVCFICLSFVLAMPVLHMHLDWKERKQTELTAVEMIRPKDEWLAFLLQDGLHSAVQEFQNDMGSLQLGKAKQESAAFRLWIKTSLSKRGYNSALVLYNDNGDEIDRFSVGMNSYEQREILTKVFNSEEESVQSLQTSGSINGPKLYGLWSTLRDTNARVLGSIALITSTSRDIIAGTDEHTSMSNQPSSYSEFGYRDYVVCEYEHGRLNSVYPKDAHMDPALSNEVLASFDSTKQSFWYYDKAGNGGRNVLYFCDQRDPEKILAIVLVTLDLRWYVYSYIKIALLYFLVASFFSFSTILYHHAWKKITVSFGTRLFIGFTVIAIFPMVILGYYNRTYATELTKQRTKEQLTTALDAIEQKLLTDIENENDFKNGIDDDFCEAISAEYGVDFSIFNGSKFQAGSRSELYRAGLIDQRLDATIFMQATNSPNEIIVGDETLGRMSYTVGYKALRINGKIAGFVTVPTLNRQVSLEQEIAQRNAFIVSMYFLTFVILIIATAIFARRLTRPLHELTYAAQRIKKGDLNVVVADKRNDELGNLIESFNEMTQELQRSRNELGHLEREKAWREMAKQVAHEIRNPLTPLKLSLQHLRQIFSDKDPDREAVLRDVTKSMIEQIETLSRIAAEFSDFARMPDQVYDRFDLADALRDAVALFSQIHGVDFIISIDNAPFLVVADKDQLRRAFINLIRNAIQAMEKGGKIFIDVEAKAKTYVITIRDTGSGINPEIIEKIFEPNFSTKTEGMGMGLAITRKIVENNGGTISCSSTVNKGTTFELLLPR